MAKRKRVAKKLSHGARQIIEQVIPSARLSVKGLGLSLGILSAFAMVFMSLWVVFIGTGQGWIDLTAQMYIGYSTTFMGTVLGAIYGFIDGFIGGVIIAWLYNKFR